MRQLPGIDTTVFCGFHLIVISSIFAWGQNSFLHFLSKSLLFAPSKCANRFGVRVPLCLSIFGIFVYIWYFCLYLVFLSIFGIFVYIWYFCLYLVFLSIFGIFVYIWYFCLYLVFLSIFGIFVYIWYFCLYLVFLSIFGIFVYIWYFSYI